MLKENSVSCVTQTKWSWSSLPFLKSKALTFSNAWLIYCQEGESPAINELLYCTLPSKPGLCNQLSWTLWISSHHLILIMSLHLVQLSVWDNMLKIHCCTFFFFLLIDFFFPSKLNECFIGWELNNVNGMNCGESQRNHSYSGESRSIQLYPACLLWCLWPREWCVVQTTYSPGPGSQGSQRGEEIVKPAQHTCSVSPASFFTDCTGNWCLAALSTVWFHVFVPCLILSTVVWACVHLRHHGLQFECILMWERCLCLSHNFWIGKDDVFAVSTGIGQCRDTLHLAQRDQLWRWICLR